MIRQKPVAINFCKIKLEWIHSPKLNFEWDSTESMKFWLALYLLVPSSWSPTRCSWSRRSRRAGVGPTCWRRRWWYRRWCCRGCTWLVPGRRGCQTGGRWRRRYPSQTQTRSGKTTHQTRIVPELSTDIYLLFI